MKCDRALLSAYLDNELKSDDRHALELHVTSCADCAEQLERYRRLRFDIRDEPVRRAPAQLRSNVEARISDRRRQQRLRWLPLAVGAPLTLIGVLTGAALVAPRGESAPQLAVTATSPMTGAKRVAPNGAVELWFDRELMPATSGLTVTVDPPIPVRVTVEGNGLRIEPDGAFEPGQNYTVAVQSVLDVDGRRLKNPAIVSFATAPASFVAGLDDLGSPRGESSVVGGEGSGTEAPTQTGVVAVALPPISSVSSTVGGTAIDTVELSAQTRKWPVSRTTSTVPIAEPSPSSLAVGDVLGVLQVPYQTVRVLEQAFQGGVMIRLGDSAQTLVLQRGRGSWDAIAAPPSTRAEDQADSSLPPPPGALAPTGTFAAVWQSTPSIRSALGWAVYEPRLASALVQRREHGTAVALGRMAYLLRSDGTWSVVSVNKTASPAN